MILGIVGDGRAARALRPLCEAAGVTVAWQWSRRSGAPLAGLPAAEVVLLAVADGAIAEVAHALGPRPSSTREVWLHLSGSLPGSTGRAAPGVPAAAGAFHPLQALPGGEIPPELLRGVVAGLDGDPAAVDAGRRLAGALGMRGLVLDPATKPLYHAAAVTVAGHAVALFAQGLRMLEAAGLEPEAARKALLPLLTGAVGALASRPPATAITGPVSRGDAPTVAAHLRALDALDPHLAATYRALCQTALALSAPGLPAGARAALEALLAAHY